MIVCAGLRVSEPPGMRRCRSVDVKDQGVSQFRPLTDDARLIIEIFAGNEGRQTASSTQLHMGHWSEATATGCQLPV